jgi:malate dehydrogenase (quinone)
MNMPVMPEQTDVLLIGAGIMSATLGTVLKELEPSLTKAPRPGTTPNTEFDLSRQLWAFLVGKSAIPDTRAFIHPCPHMSVVWGQENVEFLRPRQGHVRPPLLSRHGVQPR